MNYPNGMKKINLTHNITYSNRGMSLENDLNLSNKYYEERDLAYIYKKPTPIKIVKVNYKISKIEEAYFDTPSTTDYNGLYKGKYLDFEAKETKSKTSFPLDNIHPHQIKHIKNITKNDGICFLIIRFTTLNLTYLLRAENFIEYINSTERKSIPLSYFNEKAYLIKDSLKPRIDYLKIVDKIMEV